MTHRYKQRRQKKTRKTKNINRKKTMEPYQIAFASIIKIEQCSMKSTFNADRKKSNNQPMSIFANKKGREKKNPATAIIFNIILLFWPLVCCAIRSNSTSNKAILILSFSVCVCVCITRNCARRRLNVWCYTFQIKQKCQSHNGVCQ